VWIAGFSGWTGCNQYIIYMHLDETLGTKSTDGIIKPGTMKKDSDKCFAVKKFSIITCCAQGNKERDKKSIRECSDQEDQFM
jgi:hypothetical protein